MLVAYSALGLLRIRLHIHADLESRWRRWSASFPAFVGGVVGVPVVPLMPYLQGLDIKADRAGADIGRGAVRHFLSLVISLLSFGLLDGPRALVSAGGGAGAGRHVARPAGSPRLSVDQFRIAVFWALLLTGSILRQPAVVVSAAMLNGKRSC